jgi:hypothetical protein
MSPLHKSHCGKSPDLSSFLFCPVGCTVSLTLACIGVSRAETFTPSNLPYSNRLVLCIDIAIAKSCHTTNRRHGKLLRVKLHGSSHHRRPDLVRPRNLGDETFFDDCVQEQAQHRSAMKIMLLHHNLRVLLDPDLRLLRNLLTITRSRPCNRQPRKEREVLPSRIAERPNAHGWYAWSASLSRSW